MSPPPAGGAPVPGPAGATAPALPDPQSSATSLRAVAAGVVGVVLLVVGLFGGYREVAASERDVETVPTVPVGRTVEAGPWLLTPTNAAYATELGRLRAYEPENRIIAVSVIVELIDDTSRNPTGAAVLTGIPGVAGEPRSTHFYRGGELAFQLHPNLPERLVYVWEVPARLGVPKAVTIELIGATKRRDSLSGRVDWHDEAPVARVELPVEDRTTAEQAG